MDIHTIAAPWARAAIRPVRATAVMMLLPLLGGCTAAAYYWQGIRGQFDLLERARPIPTVLATTEDPALKRKLELVLAIRDYASRELGLPDNPSYRSYTDLGRRYVIWNVFATPELSLEPRQWCFPVAGCVNYRGYFEEAAARAEASQLGATGDDVYVGGVPAYSTLGYFNDPMLSTVIRYPDTEVARLIFHELAHQVAYAKDDTVFNESFAVAVEEEGLSRWLAAQNDPALTAQFATSQRYRNGFRTLVDHARSDLTALYTSSASVEEKRARKAAAFVGMRAAYDAMKKEWGGFAAYDRWFAQGPNNANLAAVGLYSQKVPEFHALLAEDGGNLPQFYAHVKTLAGLSKGGRDTALAAAASNRAAARIPAPTPVTMPSG